MTNQELQKFQGYIRPAPQVEGREEAARVALVADDGTEYHILHKGVGVDLVEHISADVEVNGTLHTQDDVPYVQVRTYRLVDDYQDEWYDDEDA